MSWSGLKPQVRSRTGGVQLAVALLGVIAAFLGLIGSGASSSGLIWAVTVLLAAAGVVLLLQARLDAAAAHRRVTALQNQQRSDLQALAARLDDQQARLDDRHARVWSQLKALQVDTDAIRRRVGTLRSDFTQELTRSGRETSTETVAALQVQRLLKLEARPMPLLGGWAVDASTLIRLHEAVLQLRPSIIVELGSGTSTLLLAAAASTYGGQVFTFDHDEQFAELTRQRLVAQGLADVAQVRHAPLTEVAAAERNQRWYDPAMMTDLQQIGLLLIDGPPKATGEHARYPAWPLLRDRMAAGAYVFLDDADRLDERAIIEQWRAADPALRPLPDWSSRQTAAFGWQI